MLNKTASSGALLELRRSAGRLSSILLLSALGHLVGAVGCETEPCTPDHPDYDPDTMTCPDSGDTLGPPVFGSGDLPTEPGTETPEPADPNHDPDAVDVDIYGLNGRWDDNGSDACIQHTGSGVFAWYVEIHECDHGDGTSATSVTYEDFEGQLVGDTLDGTITVCWTGFSEPSENGFTHEPLTLTIGPDGKTLSGTWHNPRLDEDLPIQMTRLTVGNCAVPE